MQTIRLKGNETPVFLSKIILGTGAFGTSIPAEEAFRMLYRYLELGGSTLDTARVYGTWGPTGRAVSEKTIGAWLRSRGSRSRVTLVTKGGHPPLSDMHRSRLSETEIRTDIEESLRTLGTDWVELFLLHRDEVSRPAEEIVDTLDRLVKEGKALAVGVSNWTAERIEEANRYARRAGKTPLAVSQIQWSFARTTPQRLGDTTLVCMNDEEYARYRRMRLPVMAYSSQAGGLFTKWLRGGEQALSEGMRHSYMDDENRRRLERLTCFCRETGCPPSAAVLAYITHNPLPGAALIGCSRLEQLEDSLTGCDRRFTPDELAILLAE